MPSGQPQNETTQLHSGADTGEPGYRPRPLDKELAASYTLKLENAFNKIYRERMQDVPVINTRIEVAVVGLQHWQDSILCIMITPWFMNIMLLPGEAENWDDMRETSSTTHTFPSGRYEFLVGYEDDIGKYQMCSLFSPMFEFADHNAAIETAQAAILALMDAENIDAGDINSKQIENIWNGTEPHPDKGTTDSNDQAATKPIPEETLEEKLKKPISRRQLLRRVVSLDDEAVETNKTT